MVQAWSCFVPWALSKYRIWWKSRSAGRPEKNTRNHLKTRGKQRRPGILLTIIRYFLITFRGVVCMNTWTPVSYNIKEPMKVCSLIWSDEKPELHRWAHSMHQGPQERTNGCSLASLWKLSYQQLPSCRRLMDGHPCGNWSTLSHSIVSLEPSFLWLLHPLSSFSKGSYPVWPQQMLVLFPHCMIHLNPNLHLCFQEVRVIKLTSETRSH